MREPISAVDTMRSLNTVRCPECGEIFHYTVVEVHRYMTHKVGACVCARHETKCICKK